MRIIGDNDIHSVDVVILHLAVYSIIIYYLKQKKKQRINDWKFLKQYMHEINQ